MSTRRTYIATTKYPIYAGWVCEKCNEINFSEGFIQYQSQATSTALRPSKQVEAYNKAKIESSRGAANYVIEIMQSPKLHTSDLFNNVILKKSKCRNCKKRPNWTKGSLYQILKGILPLAIIVTVITFLVVLGKPTGFIPWLVFALAVSACVLIYVYLSNREKRIGDIKAKYFPRFGSLNEQLIKCANNRNIVMPTPEKVIDIIAERQRKIEEGRD